MANNDERVLRAFEALEKADADLTKTKQELNKVMDERSYLLLALKNNYSTYNISQVVENDSHYVYLMDMYARAYYDRLKAQKLVCQILNKGAELENKIKASTEKVDFSETQLSSATYEAGDMQDRLIAAKQESTLWGARETDLKYAEDAFKHVLDEEKANKEVSDELDQQFNAFVAKNYPSLKRQPNSSVN